MKTMKIKIKKEHEIELKLSAYFSMLDAESYIKIDENKKMHHIRLANNELLYDIDPFLMDHVIENYAILNPKEGAKVWRAALNELKARINELR